MPKHEVEKAKAFMSRRVDMFRPPYGRHPIKVPRQSVIIGTTNSPVYLKDASGSRRYLPVACGAIDIHAVRQDRDQLWAEARHLYLAGESWWLTDRLDVEAAQLEQEDRRTDDPWTEDIAAYINGKDAISVAEILKDVCLKELAQQTYNDQMRVVMCLTELGWELRPPRGPRPRQAKLYRPRA